MTSFVHIDYPTQHPGVVRAENAVAALKDATQGFEGARGTATLLLAAVVSALLVVANQVIDTWSEGHLLAAWMVLWVVGFAALALLAAPTRRAGLALRGAMGRWAEARRLAAEDERTWNLAQQDYRVMADLILARDRLGIPDARYYR